MGVIWLYSKRLIDIPLDEMVAIRTGGIITSDGTPRTIREWIDYIYTYNSWHNLYRFKIDIETSEYAMMPIGYNSMELNTDIANSIGFDSDVLTIQSGDNRITATSWGNKRFLFSGWDIELPIETDGARSHTNGSKGMVTADGRTIRARLPIHAKTYEFTTQQLTSEQLDFTISFFDDLGSNTDCEFSPNIPDIFNQSNNTNYQATYDKDTNRVENTNNSMFFWTLSDRNF